jgi:hypothetical protein
VVSELVGVIDGEPAGAMKAAHLFLDLEAWGGVAGE